MEHGVNRSQVDKSGLELIVHWLTLNWIGYRVGFTYALCRDCSW